jgi:4-hydroxyphenylpyruvate dioxygenase-like putative hemolysin
MRQSIQRIDHIAILVYRENFEKYVESLSETLDVRFDPAISHEELGIHVAVSWESGLEILAPLRHEGRYWERLQKHGEGTCSIIFGVKDIDAAIARAKSKGVDVPWQITLHDDSGKPAFNRFKYFREASTTLFDTDFAASLSLCQIEPVEES